MPRAGYFCTRCVPAALLLSGDSSSLREIRSMDGYGGALYMSSTTGEPGEFELFDLRVEVVAPQGATIYCGAKPGDHFELQGEMLFLPPGQGFSIYSLAALLPLLPAKQRASDLNDWMSSDAEVACPDPNCPTRFRIIRTRKRGFKHAETTAVPLDKER